MKQVKNCGTCANMTNVVDELRNEENVMGGCFIDGHIVTTDCKACKKWEQWKKTK